MNDTTSGAASLRTDGVAALALLDVTVGPLPSLVRGMTTEKFGQSKARRTGCNRVVVVLVFARVDLRDR